MNQIIVNNKRYRTISLDLKSSVAPEEEYGKTKKIPNKGKTKINDFQCPVYFQDQVFTFQLSEIFNTACFAVLFFCGYDFTETTKRDLFQIEENYSRLQQQGALPIAITHDRVQIHYAYATPGKTPNSLPFKPSFVLASDSMDKLISASYKAIDLKTLEMKRSVVIVNRNMNIIFSCYIQNQKYLPMQAILNCFPQPK